MTEPLIYTTKGNIPCKDLRLNPVWEETPDYTKVTVEHFLGDELVRADVYVMSKKPLEIGAAQASLG